MVASKHVPLLLTAPGATAVAVGTSTPALGAQLATATTTVGLQLPIDLTNTAPIPLAALATR